MITAVILNGQAILNNFEIVPAVQYVVNSTVKINLQIQDPETTQRLIPGSSATLTASFYQNDGTLLVKNATLLFGQDDRSAWQVVLTPTDTQTIVGQNILLTLDFLGDATDIRTGMIYQAIQLITFDGQC